MAPSGVPRRRGWALPAALCLVLALGACALPGSQKRRNAAEMGAVRQDISGRISVVTGEPPAQKNLYGGFKLELLSAGRGEFDVFTPLGQMIVQATWSPRSARLDDGRQTRDYPSFEAMTLAGLGLALPRAALQDWVRGEPAAALPFTQLASGGFEQLGWRVQPRFEDGRLRILRASRLEGGAAQLSLVIDHAQDALPPAAGSAPARPARVPASQPQ